MKSVLEMERLPHRRWNPLLREWVLVSPHRTQRPWQGQTEATRLQQAVPYDPNCYLCPGNVRAGGHKNPDYEDTFVFTNDYSALLPDADLLEFNESDLLVAATERGLCRVVCFSPRHDLTISNMPSEAVRRVVDVWAEQYAQLGALEWVNHVQIFENRGEMMGASNPHPHCQIWANATVPNIPRAESDALKRYAADHDRCMLCEYVRIETEEQVRVIFSTKHFLAVIPFWAVWPFEALVLPRTHWPNLLDMSDDVRADLALALQGLTSRYDKLFQVSFPYSMGCHQSPTDGASHPEWHMHAHYFPPLLRSATVRKFMVGYEMLAGPQRDITPESAAELLRRAG